MLAMTSELRSHIKNFDKEVKKAMPLTEKIVVLQSEFKKIAKSDPVRAQGILDEIKILDPKSFAIYVKADNIKDKYYVTYEKYEKLVAKLN